MSNLKKYLIIILEFFKDILSPKKCFLCGNEGNYLCKNCFDKQDNFKKGFCYICKRKSKYFKIHKKCLIENKLLSGKNFNNTKIFIDRIIVLTHYKNKVIKKLIKYFKFYGKKDIGEEFGEKLGNYIIKNSVLNDLIEKNINLKKDMIILPVPLFFLKKWKRGFNQSEIISKKLSEILNIKYSNKVIIRKKYTRQQSTLNKEERLKNLNNSFNINKNKVDKVDNKIILLIDDVVSTGTTLNEISKLLKQNGAKKVIGICIASN